MGINMMNQLFLVWLFLLLVQVQGLTGGVANECKQTRCSDEGPAIRFPFCLKGHQPNHCCYPSPGFELFCSQSNQTSMELLQLPLSVNVSVKEINYKSQFLLIQVPDYYCSMELLPNSLSASPFNFSTGNDYQFGIFNLSLFSCPSQAYRDDYVFVCRIPGFGSPGQERYEVTYDSDTIDVYSLPELLSCTKMRSITIPYLRHMYNNRYSGYYYEIALNWFEPICRKCEESGKYCRLSNNSSREHNNATECFGMIPTSGKSTIGKIERGVIPTGMFLLVVIIAMYFVHRSNKLKKEDVERFLEDYRTLKPTRYTYSEIKKFTNKFKDKLGQGGYGTVYKGKLSNDVYIAAKILNNFKGNGDEFINEVGTIGRIHHVNVVRLVGYCADGSKRALVYEYLPNDTLQKFIPSDHQETCLLGWEKMHDIAVGIAKGIEYLHQGCDQRILHFDIKPHNVLLDHNFNPKISDCGLAKLCSKEQSAVSMTAARGTVGYIAPEVFSRNFGNVSYKSDVYSFGMLLLEMVGGRKNTNTNATGENTSEVYFPEWIYNNLNHRIGEQAIQIEEDGDAKIVNKLTIVGLWCIQWYPGDRPAMKAVVQMLEGDGDTLAMPPNPFSTTHSVTAGRTIGGWPYSSSLEVISESE